MLEPCPEIEVLQLEVKRNVDCMRVTVCALFDLCLFIQKTEIHLICLEHGHGCWRGR